MKIKISTRIYNEVFFIKDFLNYYFNLGIDEIHIFDSYSFDGTLEILGRIQDQNGGNRVILARSNKNLRHTSYKKQTDICNLLLDYAISDFMKSGEETIWIFPDVDEFIRVPQNYKLRDFLEIYCNTILRTVFIEWYLPPRLARKNLKPLETLDNLKYSKGRLMDLWGDPFYKDYILRLSSENIEKFKNLKTISGFHRLILDGKLLIPSNKHFMVIDHIRGGAIEILQNRIEKSLKLLENKEDEWSYQHFSYLKSLIENYETFYQNDLIPFKEIMKKLGKIEEFDNNSSYFNNVIMRDNLEELGVSKPSMHESAK